MGNVLPDLTLSTVRPRSDGVERLIRANLPKRRVIPLYLKPSAGSVVSYCSERRSSRAICQLWLVFSR